MRGWITEARFVHLDAEAGCIGHEEARPIEALLDGEQERIVEAEILRRGLADLQPGEIRNSGREMDLPLRLLNGEQPNVAPAEGRT